ncbi:ribosomal RNA processing protein 1 homolog A-like [Panonychus citri]|uniref:ribosomal RNA processing protein 1 homolog A-like n=1 Tax=Panonychus citri TaxID=50023 RepID=UPI0023074E61|nr:ribosomal RNA processing protein 1 homolog A-like [Panonychus citri]XP_053210111.1 ribosomal RNA processing protein 1 homolog A-like [Panonychus citri]
MSHANVNGDSVLDSGLELLQQSNGMIKKTKRNLQESGDVVQKKKKKKSNQTIKKFVHHVCSPISNEKRRKAVAAILAPTHNFNQSELEDLWKGMFFAVWYTEVTKCEEILHDIAYNCRYQNEKDYLITGFKLLAREWMGIDFFRVDKYALLVRHMINRSLRVAIFDSEPRDFNFLNEIFIASDESVEMLAHILEVYIEELQNVTMRQVIWDPNDKCDVYISAIRPVIKAIPRNSDSRILSTSKESIFKEIRLFLRSECQSNWRDKFCQEIFKELIDTGKEDNMSATNRKALFKIAAEMKRS